MLYFVWKEILGNRYQLHCKGSWFIYIVLFNVNVNHKVVFFNVNVVKLLHQQQAVCPSTLILILISSFWFQDCESYIFPIILKYSPARYQEIELCVTNLLSKFPSCTQIKINWNKFLPDLNSCNVFQLSFYMFK